MRLTRSAASADDDFELATDEFKFSFSRGALVDGLSGSKFIYTLTRH